MFTKHQPCENCEYLKHLIDVERAERNKLLDLLFSLFSSEPEVVAETKELPKPLTSTVPWSVRKQMLEAEDRQKARILYELDNSKKSVEDLEKEMGILDHETNDTGVNKNAS